MVRGASSLVCMKVGLTFRLWGAADMEWILGPTKYEALIKFFDSVLEGTADLTPIKSEPAPTPEPEPVVEEEVVAAETEQAIFETEITSETNEGVTGTATLSVSVGAETATAEEGLTVAASASATASSVPPKDEL